MNSFTNVVVWYRLIPSTREPFRRPAGFTLQYGVPVCKPSPEMETTLDVLHPRWTSFNLPTEGKLEVGSHVNNHPYG
jgi:hypothetical protein